MDFPAALHYDIAAQVWVEPLADGSMRVGVTALGVKLSGEFFMCRPKPVGQVLERGRSMAVAELAKSIVSITAPLSGEVVEVNTLLAQEPERIHLDCWGSGWVLRLRPTQWEAECQALLHGDAVPAAMAEHARLFLTDLNAADHGV